MTKIETSNNLDIQNLIFKIRNSRVMIDADLARLYGTSTKRLNQQVNRNKTRFPDDFMFQLNQREKDELVANCDRLKNLKHSSTLPHAFTEHGALMLANVLSSPIAVITSISVVRAFIKMRTFLNTNEELTLKLEQIESVVATHDGKLKIILEAIREIMAPQQSRNKRPIGIKS